MTLWIIIALLLVLAVAYIGWRGRVLRAAPELTAEAVYAARRAELEAERAITAIDDSDEDSLKRDLARIALGETPRAATPLAPGARTVALLALIGLLAAVTLPVYLTLGMPGYGGAREPASAPGAPGDHPSMAQMVEELEKRAKAAPKDPEPHLWLARVHMSTKAYGKAVDEFETVIRLSGESAPVLVQYADALAMVNGGRLAGRPAELLQRALKVEPEHPTALWLTGLAEEEAGHHAAALEYLQRARKAAVAAEQPVEELDQQIAALGGAVPSTPTPATGTSATDAGSHAAPSLRVTVTLAPALAAKVGPEAALFVLAKRPAGMPMPLAVKRLAVGELPTTVVLDDSLAMAPTARLSSAEEVDVIARISQKGQPIAASGDLEGRQAGVKVGPGVELSITIDNALP